MDLMQRLWIVLRRRWPVLLAFLAIALIAGAVYNTTQDREYIATTELFLRAPDVKTSAGAYQGDLFSRQRAQTYSNMLRSDELAQMVIDKLGLQMAPEQLSPKVKASTITNTVIMTISATDSNPQRAANIANGYGSVFALYVAKVENVENDPNVPPLVQVITTATSDTTVASGFSPVLVLAGACILGIVAGIAAVWLLEHYDTKLRSRRAIEQLSDSRMIGRLPFVRGLTTESVSSAFLDSEDFRLGALRLGLIVDRSFDQGETERKARIVAMVSSREGEGKSVVAQALAEALASRGVSCELISGARPIDEDFASRIELARAGADIVITDPAAFDDSLELVAESADAVIIVVRPGISRQEDLATVTNVLHTLGTPVLGVVANKAGAPKTVDGIFA